MNPNLSGTVTNILMTLAEKLGTTVEYLWGVLIKQAFIEGIVNTIEVVIVSIILFVIYRFCKHIHIKITEEDWDEGVYIAVGIFGIISLFLLCF